MGVSELLSERKFPGKNCDLCGGYIYYGENISTGQKVAFDKDPVWNHATGEIALVDPDLVDDAPHVVKFVPENERWMHDQLFTAHRSTCVAWAECSHLGLNFDACKKRVSEHNGRKPFLTASIRDMRSGRSSTH